MAKVVNDLIKHKSKEVWTIDPEASVYDAIELMAAKRIGALVVTKGGKVIGIITERDYARKVILEGRSSKSTTVHEIMTGRVIYVEPDQLIEECMALMTEKRIRHLPVLEGERLVGVISIGDVVKAIISEKEFLIEQLTRYISGN
jgi:CBS domain-containing protein